VSSRQAKKEARRQERLAREAAEAKAAARRKRLSLAGGVLGALLVIAAVIFAVTTGVGGNDETDAAGSAARAGVKLPEQQTSDLAEAAKAAGCTVENAEYESAGHEEKDFTAADYKTNPPTSGTHFPEWYEDGVYVPGTTPNLGMLVHTLEHGRINVQYKPGTPKADVVKLEALLAEQNEGYHMLLYQNETNMPYAVAATGWTQKIGCKKMNDKVFDALRTFRARYIDKGPEQVP
jgi:hypothetical protein